MKRLHNSMARACSRLVDLSEASSISLVVVLMAAAAGPAWGQFTSCTGGVCYTGGNVGIGTTSPVALLQVAGNSELFGSSNKVFGNSDATDYYIGHYPVTDTDGLDLHWFGGIRLGTAVGPVVQVTQAGNVGIGTTNPAYPLDISGTGITALRINGTAGNSASNNTQLRFAGGKSGELWAIGPDVATNSGSRDFSFWALGGVGPVMTWQNSSGNVGIGTTNPQHLLHVAGTIGAEEVIVSSTGADYVFQPGYRLRPLSEINAFIQENHHLPDIPSEAEVKENGLSLGDMQAKLLAKVEELTLHMIEADERSKRDEERNKSLEQQNRELQERIARLEAAGQNPEKRER